MNTELKMFVNGYFPIFTQKNFKLADLHVFSKIHVRMSGVLHFENYLSRVMRKPTICICENKEADQLCGNREADQRLCFRYLDSTIPLLPKYKI